jgi:hypothetical protein
MCGRKPGSGFGNALPRYIGVCSDFRRRQQIQGQWCALEHDGHQYDKHVANRTDIGGQQLGNELDPPIGRGHRHQIIERYQVQRQHEQDARSGDTYPAPESSVASWAKCFLDAAQRLRTDHGSKTHREHGEKRSKPPPDFETERQSVDCRGAGDQGYAAKYKNLKWWRLMQGMTSTGARFEPNEGILLAVSRHIRLRSLVPAQRRMHPPRRAARAYRSPASCHASKRT